MLFFKKSIDGEYTKYVSNFLPHIIMILCVPLIFFSIMFADVLDLDSNFLVYFSIFFIVVFVILYTIWIRTHPILGIFGIKSDVDFIKKGGLPINPKNPLVLLIKSKDL